MEKETFGDRLVAAGRRYGKLCVGIDPHQELLGQWGLSTDLSGLRKFSEICVAAFSDTVALVKPQVAFYEAYGSAGFAVLEHTIAQLRESGTLVLADAKRGDIGSTMAGYAHAWLSEDSPLCCDGVTVSPFLGYGSLKPVLDLAREHNKGVFVLAATSNPEARELQSHSDVQGKTVSQHIVDEVAATNEVEKASGHYGNVGVVVGATLSHSQAPTLEKLHGPILLPGVGAQGATARDVECLTKGVSELAFPNASRSILAAGPDVAAMRAAIKQLVADLEQ
ncbi:orotidine-5'-phosphate decarboxylase [Corynebacterium sp. sy017]|uniref:orotidine-5'-phosphate decarboxylase n=1 Tax=unclassified Corynebacterium TaxID=2624378 RepID=UPI00118574AC|nr:MULTISPECIES: orotidine-5'-phosphate decarboxylase [unclassified Corynebacterium]MBP3087685.1 orotidine-5'-phosphate decarboxylase [Corynebacterium sp. sy017]TSD92245.1 orotidine-5'-phosphate decarboxylase [Corynebacterium sp. SY003]